MLESLIRFHELLEIVVSIGFMLRSQFLVCVLLEAIQLEKVLLQLWLMIHADFDS